VQLNTEGSCHLTAHMIEEVLPRFELGDLDVLAIENIGNLICPASYSLGEHKRIACLSTAEGADKADKYPRLFSICQANVITKTDLAEHVDFDVARVTDTLTRLNPAAPVFATSVRQREGLDPWCDWLKAARAEVA
jgi:hydrogenase nickel incorporation protein HypB